MQETFAFGTLSRLIPQVFSFNKVNAHIRTHHKDLLHIYKAPTLSHLKRELSKSMKSISRYPPPTPKLQYKYILQFSTVHESLAWEE